jgi:uncharacterized protein YuzE
MDNYKFNSTYDEEVKALYVYCSPNSKIDRQEERECILDIDKDGRLIGIELLDVELSE